MLDVGRPAFEGVAGVRVGEGRHVADRRAPLDAVDEHGGEPVELLRATSRTSRRRMSTCSLTDRSQSSRGGLAGHRSSSLASTIGGLSRRAALGAGILAVVALLAAGCGGSDDDAAAPVTTVSRPRTPFDYDASAPLDVRDRGRVNENYPVAVHDVSYASPGGRVDAFLVVPPAAGRRPGAVILHGGGGNREQLLLNALWLAGRGAVTMAITAPSAKAAAASSRGLSPDRRCAASATWRFATPSPCGARSTCSPAGRTWIRTGSASSAGAAAHAPAPCWPGSSRGSTR